MQWVHDDGASVRSVYRCNYMLQSNDYWWSQRSGYNGHTGRWRRSAGGLQSSTWCCISGRQQLWRQWFRLEIILKPGESRLVAAEFVDVWNARRHARVRLHQHVNRLSPRSPAAEFQRPLKNAATRTWPGRGNQQRTLTHVQQPGRRQTGSFRRAGDDHPPCLRQRPVVVRCRRTAQVGRDTDNYRRNRFRRGGWAEGRATSHSILSTRIWQVSQSLLLHLFTAAAPEGDLSTWVQRGQGYSAVSWRVGGIRAAGGVCSWRMGHCLCRPVVETQHGGSLQRTWLSRCLVVVHVRQGNSPAATTHRARKRDLRRQRVPPGRLSTRPALRRSAKLRLPTRRLPPMPVRRLRRLPRQRQHAPGRRRFDVRTSGGIFSCARVARNLSQWMELTQHESHLPSSGVSRRRGDLQRHRYCTSDSDITRPGRLSRERELAVRL